MQSRLPFVRLDRVYAGHGDRIVLSGVSLAVYAGERLALVGPNGAGKSTLLGLLHGDVRPSQGVPAPGRVLFGFEGKEDASPLCARKHVRLVSPSGQARYARHGWLVTGEEIILSGLDNTAMVHGEADAIQRTAARELAESVGAGQLLELPAPAMSQGQLRLALILRALMAKPALLLLDEPFDGLDDAARAAVARLISSSGTLVLAVHRPEDVPSGIRRAVIIQDGVTHPCSMEELTARISPPISPSFPAVGETAGVFHDPVAPEAPSGGDTLLRLEHVDVFIERRQVLFNISWTVRTGERWLVSGANGSGKSTLLRLLYGEEFAAFGGVVLWKGTPRPSLETLRKEIGYVSDRLQQLYDDELGVEEVILSGCAGTVGLRHEPSEPERTLARRWMILMGLDHLAKRPLHSLSSGTARRVFLARALAFSPPVLLLDEPCSGLDAPSRALFFSALPVLAARGVQIIYVSHRTEEHSRLFTHELRLDHGRVVFAGERRGMMTRRP